MDFSPFHLNRGLSVKSKANLFGFESKLDIFENIKNLCTTP
jgi:hypothetical protein